MHAGVSADDMFDSLAVCFDICVVKRQKIWIHGQVPNNYVKGTYFIEIVFIFDVVKDVNWITFNYFCN